MYNIEINDFELNWKLRVPQNEQDLYLWNLCNLEDSMRVFFSLLDQEGVLPYIDSYLIIIIHIGEVEGELNYSISFRINDVVDMPAIVRIVNDFDFVESNETGKLLALSDTFDSYNIDVDDFSIGLETGDKKFTPDNRIWTYIEKGDC